MILGARPARHVSARRFSVKGGDCGRDRLYFRGMKALPSNVAAYRRTKTFTRNTVPKGLLADHNTKAGVWGVITVLEGQLEYVIPSSNETLILGPDTPGVVEPEVPHHVRPLGPATFFVEFYR